METENHEQAGGDRPVVLSGDQTDAQRRLARQGEQIRNLESMMRGVVAFARHKAE